MKNLVSVFSIIYYATKLVIIVALLQWWLGDANAAETSLSRQQVEMLESQRELLNLLGDGTFDFKETINCTKLETGRDPYSRSRAITQFYRCADMTLSFPQPDSTGYNGWNGFCGQTAVSNVTGMFCQRFITPQTIDTYATDVTPGNLPGTNRKALKKIFAEGAGCPTGNWKEKAPWTGGGYIEDLKKALWKGAGKVRRLRNSGSTIEITPVPVLIAAAIDAFHWVVLVDFRQNNQDKYGCDAVVNTWGNQKLLTCENLVKYGNVPLLGYRFLSFEP